MPITRSLFLARVHEHVFQLGGNDAEQLRIATDMAFSHNNANWDEVSSEYVHEHIELEHLQSIGIRIFGYISKLYIGKRGIHALT